MPGFFFNVFFLLVFQVISNYDTQEVLLCLAFVFEVSNSDHGTQHHVYRLIKDWECTPTQSLLAFRCNAYIPGLFSSFLPLLLHTYIWPQSLQYCVQEGCKKQNNGMKRAILSGACEGGEGPGAKPLCVLEPRPSPASFLCSPFKFLEARGPWPHPSTRPCILYFVNCVCVHRSISPSCLCFSSPSAVNWIRPNIFAGLWPVNTVFLWIRVFERIFLVCFACWTDSLSLWSFFWDTFFGTLIPVRLDSMKRQNFSQVKNVDAARKCWLLLEEWAFKEIFADSCRISQQMLVVCTAMPVIVSGLTAH